MKNRIYSALILIFGASLITAQAQTNDPLQVQFGVKGGVNFSNMYTEDVDDDNMLTSFNAGLYVNIPVSSSLSIQPEFLYSRKGSELSYDNLFATGTAKFKLNYIEVPVLLKMNVTDNFNIHVGPYVAYLIDSQVTNESSEGTYDFESNFDNDDFNKFDAGLSAGIGFDFDSFGIGARYNYGLIAVGKERDFGGTTYTVPDGKNSNISIYFALKLN
ncbi:porin family protein [Confluentibacter citreus]|uniref:porin family protein n=1 Tax=Confluentibacter citreus TaxID=2007307 RepID=UPI000C288EC3|nr:porin family protein [Confluentibacter citreus]